MQMEQGQESRPDEGESMRGAGVDPAIGKEKRQGRGQKAPF